MGCSPDMGEAVDVDEWPAIYPDYVGVTVPVQIAPLNFSMADDSVTAVDVEVRGSKGTAVHARGEFADFDMTGWHALLSANRGDSLTVTVCCEKNGQWLRYRPFTVYVSNDSLQAWGITYRRIAPGYVLYGSMGIYQRDLSSFEETAIIDNSSQPGQCMNCHTPNRTNPDQYVLHVRGVNGGTLLPNEVIRGKNDSLGGPMVYPYWHPGGRYVAFSTNKTSQMFHLSGRKRVEVYDSSSDVFVYDTEKHDIMKDTLIMRKYWAENTPAFSPDGLWLYFTTARRQIYPTDYDKERYSLCRVSFDAESGRIGSRVDTLVSADRTGMSVSWPRPSYDGRYVMYTQADYGYFTVWHPEADLWMLDLETGERYALDSANSPRAESFHNWSADSRWFLFTSRRDDGLYTRVYLSSLTADGRATKPFMLPQHNPKEYYTCSLFSFNTPDFASRKMKSGELRVKN